MIKRKDGVYGRCATCEYAEKIVSTPCNWQFYGCRHEPYRGKMCSEIKDCPKEIKTQKCDCSHCGINIYKTNQSNMGQYPKYPLCENCGRKMDVILATKRKCEKENESQYTNFANLIKGDFYVW